MVRWLSHHPGVQIICRDRDGVYASAATRGAPGALQVADGWHLVHKLAEALERFALRVLPRVPDELARSAPPPGRAVLPAAPGSTRPIRRTREHHEEVHALLSTERRSC